MQVWDGSKRWFVALGSLALVGCGGQTKDGSLCATPAACGGNILGKWQITSSCITDAVHNLTCAGATLTLESVDVTGTVEFDAAGNEISVGTSAQAGRYSFPSTCLTQPCADTAAALKSTTSVDGSPATTDAACTTNGDTCVCDVSVAVQSNDHDTYRVSGNELTTTSASATDPKTNTTKYDVQRGTYCVSGNDLSVASDSGFAFRATRE